MASQFDLVLLLIAMHALSAQSSIVGECTPSHYNAHRNHSSMLCKHFSPAVRGLNETGAFYAVDNEESSVTRFVNCVCADCTVTGNVHDCGDGNNCYRYASSDHYLCTSLLLTTLPHPSSCSSARCTCDEVAVGPDQVDWMGGDVHDCILGGRSKLGLAQGECAVVPDATVLVPA
jgi:hypothetical protein